MPGARGHESCRICGANLREPKDKAAAQIIEIPSKPEVKPSGIQCSRCGTDNSSNKGFCRRCGAGLVEQTERIEEIRSSWRP